MARNIEIKAYAKNFAAQLKLAQNLSDTDLEVLNQRDTFFAVPQGRLKLREFPNQAAQLIYYTRADQIGPKLSDYHIAEIKEPLAFKQVLQKAYGIITEVVKERRLYLAGRTRLHFDTVEQLGEFIELEVVLTDDESPEQGQAEAEQLMQALGITQQDLIDVAYVDLLQASS